MCVSQYNELCQKIIQTLLFSVREEITTWHYISPLNFDNIHNVTIKSDL